MKLFITFFVVYIFCFATGLKGIAQGTSATAKTNGTNNFPALKFARIKGAPTLSAPQLITDETGAPVITQGYGWASPAFFDVDNDGKNDLLLGEYGSGVEHNGMVLGSYVRVYKNVGTDNTPQLSDDYTYLRPFGEHYTGSQLSVHTWCCLGFTPRLVDLDGDGFQDLVTGQYNPGLVTWFRGAEDGFFPGERLPQFGDPIKHSRQADKTLPRTDPRSFQYWNYSAVAFGDFEGKGLYDMIVGGTALRISRNTGTTTQPSFGIRELLLDIHGEPLRVEPRYDSERTDAGEPFYGGCMVPAVADWDNDGVPDLLVTDTYTHPGQEAITFFRGVKTATGIRFEPGTPLFTAKSGKKAFPGSWLHVCVADWNNDGVNDLIIGTSMVTIDGKFKPELCWDWEATTGIFKMNPGLYSKKILRIIDKELKTGDSLRVKLQLTDEELSKKGWVSRTGSFKHYFGKEEYKSLAHQGYVYVMLGTREQKK